MLASRFLTLTLLFAFVSGVPVLAQDGIRQKILTATVIRSGWPVLSDIANPEVQKQIGQDSRKSHAWTLI